MRFARVGVWTVLAVVLVAGCTLSVRWPIPVPVRPTSPAASSPSVASVPPAPARPSPAPSPTPSRTTVGKQPVSTVPSLAVDRPSYPDPGVKPDGFKPAPPGDGLSGYLGQKVTWKDCDDNTSTRCTSVLAPLDYANPGAQAITLKLRKKPATKSPRIGTLFINPGGPGGSGMDLVLGFARRGLERFDIVGWDPRGVGASTPVKCYGGKQTDALNALDVSPDTKAEKAALVDAYAAFGKSCWEHSGILLEHISTIDTARDLDLLRGLLGDKTLNFVGYSYGTQIGATYAELFGANAGRIVLDSPVDITGSEDAIQAVGFDLALDHFASWCAARKCALGSSKKAVLATVTQLLEKLDAKPLKVGKRQLTQTLAATGVAAALYSGTAIWPYLAEMVKQARDGDGSTLLAAADSLNDRSADGTYGSMFYSFPAIACLDHDDKGVLDADRLWQKDQKAAPIFGKYLGPDYVCPLWPTQPAPQLDIRGADAPPIVIVGATGDSATPYQQAVTMAKQLVSGVLVTYDGEGHGTYGGKSACVDNLVVDYLVNGKVPKDGTTCK